AQRMLPAPLREIIPKSANVSFTQDGIWLVTSTGFEHRFWRVGTWEPGPVIRKARRMAGGLLPDRSGTVFAECTTTRTDKFLDAHSLGGGATLETPAQTTIPGWEFSPEGGYFSTIEVGGDAVLWDLRAIRARLGEFGLDWNAPAIPTAVTRPPIKVEIDA